MRRVFKTFLTMIFILLIGAVLLGVFYMSYQKYYLSKGSIKVSGDLSINYSDGHKLNIKGDKKTNISIINDSEEISYYYIEFKNVKNAENVTYTITDGEDYNVSDKLNLYNSIISSYIAINPGEVKNYEFTFESKDNNAYSLEINIASENLEVNAFADVILKDNEVKSSSITEVGKAVATEDEGLITASDDYGTTYYFRGNVANNNVKIGDLNFKIVRINGDGSVKLVLDGVLDDISKYYSDIEKVDFKNSEILTKLSSWLKSNLSDYTSLIANQKYCNDSVLDNGSYYSLTRIKEDNIVSFVCIGDKVASKVGLLTLDEVIYAGATINDNNTSYYLYNGNIKNDYYLMTSASKDNNTYYPFIVDVNGKVNYSVSGENYRGIRPVITIIKTASVTGNGTIDNPYKLSN